MHSHKPRENTAAPAKMAQLPSQGVREPGRKVCSRSWLPLLAGSAAILHEILALEKIVACLLPMHTWNRREEHSCDEILVKKKKKKITKLEANLSKNMLSKIIMFFI